MSAEKFFEEFSASGPLPLAGTPFLPARELLPQKE
jgi:hypothetical protein